MSDVWSDLAGQERAVEELRRAAHAASETLAGREASGMTHAWLFTGPPGSGRSTAARALAAALQCTAAEPGCGVCLGCHTALTGTHADVELVSTDVLSIGVAQTRDLVRRAALSPAGGRWQIIVMEDADRLTEGAGNVLLKAIEEPPPRMVWLLCAPSVEDALPTIRSRCRHVALRTPPSGAVAEVLVRRDGIDPARAVHAARAAQGHIGRAKRLATDEEARGRRADVLRLPMSVGDIGGCMRAAQKLVDAAAAEAERATTELNERETEALRTALGAGATGKGMPSGSAAILKDLESRQKKRATRLQRDALDRALIDLAAFYRDTLVVQLGAADVVAPVHDDQLSAVRTIADAGPPEATLRRLDAVLAAREAIEANVAPLLAVEAMALALHGA